MVNFISNNILIIIVIICIIILHNSYNIIFKIDNIKDTIIDKNNESNKAKIIEKYENDDIVSMTPPDIDHTMVVDNNMIQKINDDDKNIPINTTIPIIQPNLEKINDDKTKDDSIQKNNDDKNINNSNLQKVNDENILKNNDDKNINNANLQKINDENILKNNTIIKKYYNSLIDDLLKHKLLTVAEIENINLKLKLNISNISDIIESLEILIKNKPNYNIENELPDDFFSPLGKGVPNNWVDEYTILNTNKWTVPMRIPPICINNNPCTVCPLDSSNYTTTKNWNNARYVLNK